VGYGAFKIPLPSTKVPWLRGKIDPLVEAAKLDPEPTLVAAFHIGRDEARSNDLAGVVVGPGDMKGPRSYSRAHGTLSNKSVEVELEPCFKADSLAGSRHENPAKFFRAWGA
jgi:hypothetical protein